ncbi:MAG: hypothetical protein WAN36_05260 [Calditrichia bacterium]
MKRHMKTIQLVIISISLSIFSLIPLQAQETTFGLRTGIYSDPGDLFIGTELLTPINENIYFNPNLEYVFIENGDYLTLNFDAHYDFDTNSNLYIWAGGGLGILYLNPDGPVDSQTALGLNMLFGLGLKTSGRLVPYVQGKAIISDNSDFSLGLGIRF